MHGWALFVFKKLGKVSLMSYDIAIRIENLSKCYHVYDRPIDRLKQMTVPRVRSSVGHQPKQYFREFWALKDVTFDVKKGEVVGIIGKNGSGKSTLLQMICGTLHPTLGMVRAQGRIAALLELGSGFNPEFTGRENVYMNAAILGLSKKEIASKFEEIVNFADIGEFIDQPVKTYSSGMTVRLAFSIMINVNPDILIIDEALAVGDELFQRKCFSRIEAIRASGATILFVSHSGAQIIELCDHAILLDGGEKIFSGSPRQTVGIYQKLLYAPPDKIDHIRSSIIPQGAEFSEHNSGEEYLEYNEIKHVSCSCDPEETYDPNLKPSSTIEYESHGPRIDIPYILSKDGKKVNGLLRGKKYRYCYQVKFEEAASCVRFGMSIKSTTGFSLAGALTAHDLKSAIGTIDKGNVVDVEFLFDCNLNPGVYFMNAGVFGLIDGSEVVLHRLAEVIAFRVLPIQMNKETEMVSLSIVPQVSMYA